MRNFLRPLDALEKAVADVWRRSGRSLGTINGYLLNVRSYRRHCAKRRLCETDGLTLIGSRKFAFVHSRERGCDEANAVASSRSALRAWSIALAQLGHSVPEWATPPEPSVASPILDRFAEHRRLHSGASTRTIERDVEFANRFLRFIGRRGRKIGAVRLADVDDLIRRLGQRMTPKTISGWCSSLRVFFRFLRSAGIVRLDIASAILGPKLVAASRPPQTLSWHEVRRLLGAIERQSKNGSRAFAILLMMISYGLGAAEVSALDLDDIDWRGQTIRIRRPKTGAITMLPLSPSVARAVAAYLRRGRSPNTSTRAIFVRGAMPHVRMSQSAIRHVVRDRAREAGVRGGIGAHVLRHTHASKQIDRGTPAKVVGDILGHRDPASTSVYVRVAFRRLQALSLPVPK